MRSEDIVFEANDVCVSFSTHGRLLDVLQHVSLELRRGEFVVLLGPSGCGKSTLLNVVAGLVKPHSGTYHHRSDASGVQRDVGYMTQDDTLLPWRSVEANIRIPLELKHHRDRWKDRKELVRFYTELVGLKGFEHFHPDRLSGGMRKRVALARTLIYDPDLLLMDEPFGALDAQLKLVMQNELLRIWESTGKTVLFVTHDLAEAITLADRIAVFSGRPGTIKTIVPVDLPRPRTAAEIHRLPQYGELYERLWTLLEPTIEP